MFTRTENFRQFISYYPAVTLILSLNILIFIIGLLPLFSESSLFELAAGVNLYINEGEWWRLLTPIFLHTSLTHLLFNCFSIAIFGPPLEQMLGGRLLTIFFLMTGITANIVTYFLLPLTYIHVGASGAIFGLLGFFLYLVLFRKEQLPRNEWSTIYILIAFAVIMTFVQPQINITGHIAGLFAGVLFAPIINKL